MADVPPPSPVSAAAAAAPVPAAGVSVIEAAVNSVPDKIQQLARQIELSGTINQPPTSNSITMNTAAGPFTFLLPQLATPQLQAQLVQQLTSLFQSQKPLTVVLQPGNPPAQAFLLLPPLGNPPQNAGAAPTAGFLQPVGFPAAPPLLPNTTLSAVVLPPGIVGLPDPAPGTATSYNASALGTVSPGANPLAPAAEPLPVNPQAPLVLPAPAANIPAPPVASPLAPAAASPASIGLQPGTELAVRVQTIIPPAAQNAQSPPALQPGQVLATVAGSGPGGQPIIKAGDTTLFLRQAADIPAGTQLIVSFGPKPDPAAYLAASEPTEFSSLSQIAAAMMQTDPAAARAIIDNLVPQPTGALPGALLFFMNAIGRGDVTAWLGSGALDLLSRANKMELLGRLTQDFAQAGQTVRDAVVGEWKSYPVPIQDGSQFQVINFYVHGDGRQHGSQPQPNEADAHAAPKPVRFLIDMRMSRLGALQLDGFLRIRQLDMIVRSENRLPSGLDQELRQVYTRAMQAVDYNGGLVFQTGRQNWVAFQQQGGRTVEA